MISTNIINSALFMHNGEGYRRDKHMVFYKSAVTVNFILFILCYILFSFDYVGISTTEFANKFDHTFICYFFLVFLHNFYIYLCNYSHHCRHLL